MDGLPSLGHKPGLLGRRRKIMIMMTMVIMMMMRSPDGWIALRRTQAKPGLFGKAPKNYDHDDHGDNSTKTKS